MTSATPSLILSARLRATGESTQHIERGARVGVDLLEAMLAELRVRGIEPRFVDGLRVTDAAMMDVVRMALLGQVNPELVGLVQEAGAPSVGVAGTAAAPSTRLSSPSSLSSAGATIIWSALKQESLRLA